MAKVKDIESVLAEQAVRKAATCYSRGVDRSDLELMKSAFHSDAEVRYGSYDGHYEQFCKDVVSGQSGMEYTTHTVVNEYYDIDAVNNSGKGEIYVLSHDPIRFKNKFLKPRTNLKNLFLTGQDIATAGVSGALVGGILTASTILNRNVIKEIVSK